MFLRHLRCGRIFLPLVLTTVAGGQVLPVDRGTLSGTVVDGTGALVTEAVISLEPLSPTKNGDKPLRAETTDRTGGFFFHLLPGQYRLHVESTGFAPFVSEPLRVTASAHLTLPVHLEVASRHEELNVGEGADPADAAGVANAMVFQGETLKALARDQTTLLQQLNALAGGMGQPRILVDGFAGGKLPPRESIRSISINKNPFSAYFSDFGLGRVEVTTQPGGEKVHGELDLSGTDQPFNAANPYAPQRAPFFDFQQSGNLSGPVGKRTSYFLSDNVENLANSSVVNAADPAAPQQLISTFALAPQHMQTYAARVDHQFSEHHFGYLRDEWNRTTVQNSGILPLVLPGAAFSSDLLSNALQLSDTQVLGPHAVNEARFQYLRTRLRQTPNETGPSVVVQSSFQAGGAPGQVLRDAQDLYESQDRFEMDAGHHTLRAGFRWAALREANLSTAGYNGQYIFADVTSYLAGRAQQYSQTAGQPQAVLSNNDVFLYAEDDWKATPDLTLSYGLRFESQSDTPDHTDPAPRVAFAWAFKPRGHKTPLFTLRGGYGIFYMRFPAAQLLQTIRQNGSRQVASVAMDVDYNPAGPPLGAVFAAGQPTLYVLDPNLRSQYTQIASLTLERSLGKFGHLTFNGFHTHDSHEYLTRNANAPLPGTFNPAIPGSGVRPLGTNANVYQYASSGNGNQEVFDITYRLQVTSKLYAFGLLKFDRNFDTSDTADSFVAHPYDLRQDYGRSSMDLVHSLSSGFLYTLPRNLQAMFFLAVHTGAPFDITTGTDLNGDTIYNDRPALAGDSLASSVVRTAYGNFDVQPAAENTEIPRNAAFAPPVLWTMLRLGRDFHLGPLPAAPAAAAGSSAAAAERPYTLNFSVEVHNLTNHNSPGPPVGAISAQPCSAASQVPCTCGTPGCELAPSVYFGHSLSLASDFSPITASNRTILLQTSFSF